MEIKKKFKIPKYLYFSALKRLLIRLKKYRFIYKADIVIFVQTIYVDLGINITSQLWISKKQVFSIIKRVNHFINNEFLAYILYKKKIRILNLFVSRGLFIPRTCTFSVIDMVFKIVRIYPCIVDICCGIGTIGVEIYSYKSFLLNIDLKPLSLFFNINNIRLNSINSNVCTISSNLFEIFRIFHKFCNVVVLNPPYIENNKIFLVQKNTKTHEPFQALMIPKHPCGYFVHKIVKGSFDILKLNGYVILEIDIFQTYYFLKVYYQIKELFLICDKFEMIRGMLYKKI